MPFINNVNELKERIEIYSITSPSGLEPGDGEKELLFECWVKIRIQNIIDMEKNYGTELQDVIQVVIRP